jgi:hypothetical protein
MEKGQKGFTTNPEYVTCTRCRQTMAFINAVGHVDPAPTHTPVKEEVFTAIESPVLKEDTYEISWSVLGMPMRLKGLGQMEFSELLAMLLDKGYLVHVHKEANETA